MVVPNTNENKIRCICPGCPTYNECMKGKEKTFFCAQGQSECAIESQGCICGECPVASDYKLNELYFCKSGLAK